MIKQCWRTCSNSMSRNLFFRVACACIPFNRVVYTFILNTWFFDQFYTMNHHSNCAINIGVSLAVHWKTAALASDLRFVVVSIFKLSETKCQLLSREKKWQRKRKMWISEDFFSSMCIRSVFFQYQSDLFVYFAQFFR